MPSWTEAELRAYETRRLSSGAKPEQTVRHDPLGQTQGEEKNPSRIAVCITSFRQRLLDPDNLIGGTKSFVDGLRYSGVLPGDSPDKIVLEVSQVKVKNKSDERTEIEVIL